jgi:hypothetical protein
MCYSNRELVLYIAHLYYVCASRFSNVAAAATDFLPTSVVVIRVTIRGALEVHSDYCASLIVGIKVEKKQWFSGRRQYRVTKHL